MTAQIPPVATAITLQLGAIAERWPTPRVRRLHVPQRDTAPGEHDAEFCAIELADGAFGLSYVLLGNTLQALLAAHGSAADAPLAGADPMALARGLAGGSEVERAIALGCAAEHAPRLVYTDGPGAPDADRPTPIGVSCRLCQRTSCAARSAPPIGRDVLPDDYRRTIAPFGFSD
jgi:hypothetical protein